MTMGIGNITADSVFREFDIPLKEIKAVLENPALERNQILQMQRKMLVAKKERMEHLIASMMIS